MNTDILKQIRFADLRHLDHMDGARKGALREALTTILLVNAVVVAALAIFLFLASPAHAEGFLSPSSHESTAPYGEGHVGDDSDDD